MENTNKEVATERLRTAPEGGRFERKGPNPNKMRKPRKKVCQFCYENSQYIDYKDVVKLKKYTTDKGKIIARRQTGICAKHQRELTTAIKRSRNMALMVFKGE